MEIVRRIRSKKTENKNVYDERKTKETRRADEPKNATFFPLIFASRWGERELSWRLSPARFSVVVLSLFILVCCLITGVLRGGCLGEISCVAGFDLLIFFSLFGEISCVAGIDLMLLFFSFFALFDSSFFSRKKYIFR